MRRLSDDDGAVAVLVALLSVVLFGFGAFVIDVGALYSERRQLQAGADAAALAVAQACGGGACGTFDSDAEDFADANALDGVTDVTEVCGAGAPGLPACTDPPSGLLGSGYVRVTVRTEEIGGAHLVPPTLARMLVPGYEGTQVGASATVIWGGASSAISDIPVTLSSCEFDEFTTGGLAPKPDYTAYPDLGYSTSWLQSSTGGLAHERVFFTHDTSGETAAQIACPGTSPGGDAAGSFGWLDDPSGISGCPVQTTVSPDGELGYDNAQGNTTPSECKKVFPPPGTTVFLPVFDYFTVKGVQTTNGGGNDVWYHVEGYAAFYITGYNLQLGGEGDQPSLVTGGWPCTGQERCISGFFTSALAPVPSRVGSATSYGANVVQLIS